MTIIKVIIFSVIILFAVFGYAARMVAHTSDAQADRMYRDYLKYKQKKEQEKYGDRDW